MRPIQRMILAVCFTSAASTPATLPDEPCHFGRLPPEVRKTIEQQFVGWSVVSTERLSSQDDRDIWKGSFGKACPGVISGHFRGKQTEYSVSLVRGSGASLQQQVLFFARTDAGFQTLVLTPPGHTGVVTVLRKFAPGIYTSPDPKTAVRVTHDAIGISEIEGTTVVHYWDGKAFNSIVTSL